MKFNIGDPVWFMRNSSVFNNPKAWKGPTSTNPPANVRLEATIVGICDINSGKGFAIEISGYPSGYPFVPKDCWAAHAYQLSPRIDESRETIPWSQCIWKPKELHV